MLRSQFKAFVEFRDEFRSRVAEWSKYASALEALQKTAAQKDTPDYPIETTVVYNRALDDVSAQDEIKLIVIGDNPGKDEQLSINNRYLVGQSGKIADGFFRRNPELQTDFRKNVVILNKTPVHTAKTHHLRSLQKANPEIAKLIEISQLWMAEHTAKLHRALWENGASGKQDAQSRADTDGTKIGESFNPAQLWLVGYAELKEKGIFAPYRDALKAAYAGSDAWKSVFVYQHFSMNRFLIDLKTYQKNCAADSGNQNPCDGDKSACDGEVSNNAKSCGGTESGGTSETNGSLGRDLERLGELHRKEIFGE
ncbi:hypothetical protein [Treponema socranskii]|uniref:hypothetical protein n=1 Tax=Treponema socranskii TaxID=53419 RepID=UPI0028725BBB|nr:hypothetical protein [Treponema socranskii]MDR9858335.1 hypothetical protein [Treponema socranskii]